MTSPIEMSDPMPGVRQVLLNRPESLNSMNSELVEELHSALKVIRDDQDCRVVLLTGSGRGFCSGLDLNGYRKGFAHESASTTVAQMFRVQSEIASLIPRLRSLPQPVIAAVNGPAAGGGLALVLGSDVRVAAASARFSAAFVKIGLSGCDIGTAWLLPRLIGAARAQELMLTGRTFTATEASDFGLVTKVVEDHQLLSAALEIATSIISNSPMGVWMTKETMWSALEVPGLQAAMDLENRTQVMLSRTKDHHEAVMAYRERRVPRFDYS
jgi:enoyl-CoA hydratase